MTFKIFNIFGMCDPGSVMYSGGGLKQNVCFDPVGKLGNIYGNPIGGDGVLDPTHAGSGQLVIITADNDTNLVVVALGDASDEQVDGSTQVVLEFDNAAIVLHWNESTTQYEATDAEVTANIVAAYGTMHCFALYAIPDVIIRYDYAQLFMGEV